MNSIFVNLYGILWLLETTLIGGVLPLLERKILALIQRRVGPLVVGYKGRLQFIADALKMFLKTSHSPSKINVFIYYVCPVLFLHIVYFLGLNILWTWNCIYFELEYNILYLTILSLSLNFLIIFIGFFGLNKYALLAALRNLCVFYLLEILLTLLCLNIMFIGRGFSFSNLMVIQQEYPLILAFAPLINLIVVTVLLEVSRAPFDLSEAESELISGFHIEYGAFFFGLFYLAEYFHLFFMMIIVVIFFLY